MLRSSSGLAVVVATIVWGGVVGAALARQDGNAAAAPSVESPQRFREAMNQLMSEAAGEGAPGAAALDESLTKLGVLEAQGSEAEREACASALKGMAGGVYPRPELKAAESFIERAREAGVFEATARLVKSPRVVMPWTGAASIEEEQTERLSQLGRLRRLVRLEAARMRMAAARGRPSETAEAFEAGLAVSRVAVGRLLLSDRLAGVGAFAEAATEARMLAVEGLLDGASAERMLRAVDGLRWPALRASLDAERLYVLHSLPAYLSAMGERPTRGRERVVDAVVRGDAAALRIAAGPIEPVKDDLETKMRAAVDTTLSGYASSLRELRSDMGSVEARWATERDATRIVLAAAAHRAKHGRWPASVAELVPGFLASEPVDTISGMPFGYRVDGDRVVLYSVGTDREDNGGRFPGPPKGDACAVTVDGKGYDRSYTGPRRGMPD